MTPDPTTTTTTRAPAAPPTPIGIDNEATLQRLKKEVKAPGTELGLLARGIETDLRSLQDRLNARGDFTVPAALGAGPGVPVRAVVTLGFDLHIGQEAQPRHYGFVLAANPAKAVEAPPIPAG